MSKIIGAVLVELFLFGGVASAQTPTIEELRAQIQSLSEQIQALQAQLKAAQGEAQELKKTLRFERSLTRGVRGEDVEVLQKVWQPTHQFIPKDW